ncbi:MAG: hemolysin III family protein [Betaproteobacteria bacterium]|nr:hemolysin III family protein [Betaproteobacteria bacterium]
MYPGERFNGHSHLAGGLLALTGVIVLVVLGALWADVWRVVSFAVYGASLVVLYGISTAYHSVRGRAKAILRRLDHSAHYLLIAGTYTPFTLVSLRGPWGWTLFGIVWGLAVVGILQEIWLGRGARRLSLIIYVLAGWVAVVPLIDALGLAGFAWILAGGLVYTAGLVFYLYDEHFRHWHGIWLLFVVGSSAIHYFAILFYVT